MIEINEKSSLQPFISIIIPVYNDPQGIRDTLESLVNQTYPHYEIIVADNGSKDSTLKVVNDFSEKYPGLIEVVVEDSIQSSYAARNKGIKAAKGSIIAFVDADMSVKNDWVQKITESMEKNKADYLACRVDIYSDDESLISKYNILTGFPLEEYVYTRHFAPTCCLIVKRKIFDELGDFDSNLISGGDYEFGVRVYNSGKQLFYDPEIVMYHPARSTLKQLIKKSFRIGRGFYQLSSRYPNVGKGVNKNTLSKSTNPRKKGWTFLPLRKDSYIWFQMSTMDKALIYMLAIFDKSIKIVGYLHERYVH